MLSKVAATGTDNWSKVLKSSIGNICFSVDQKWLLVDNLAKGFDLYDFPHTSPSDSFPVSRTKAFIQQGIFLEDETSIACGSDHGQIHIFSLGTSKSLQKLKQGSAKTMVQVLDACSTTNQHLIASGTDEKKPVIHVWEKKAKGRQEEQRTSGCNSITLLVFLNIFMILFVVLWTVGSAKEVLDNAEGFLKRNGIPEWQ
ncbi:hypothetical protein BYT27DRAFT_7142257 [Phlegmacium glaucopus]|nr:hypothetical protein BYT27DRAFT_7142257 [Phlegmacium glaucopus]